jgi:hypothetical protein
MIERARRIFSALLRAGAGAGALGAAGTVGDRAGRELHGARVHGATHSGTVISIRSLEPWGWVISNSGRVLTSEILARANSGRMSAV